ncbi:MATE family efflux transporter [Diaphorobacter aerolatus]|uniref:MATE family efflux transporter n=1 Tax=Diaphorobacter aerolatus TaxID=1288495 RepID=UPI0021F7A533|nr:MATE family efflux transporter [Diaphorobacter aerolatus]
MAIGAGQVARARRVAWTAGCVSALALAVLGLTVMWLPRIWSGMFTNDAAVLANADLYLRTTGPGFAFFGFGLTLYFASLGSGRVLGPILAGSARLALVAIGGAWLAQRGGGSPSSLFWLALAAMVVYGVATGWAVRRTRWG